MTPTTLVAPTTTTLPIPVSITGTTPVGPYAFLGPVERVAVVPSNLGAVGPPELQPSASEVADSVRVGFRSFGSGPDLLLIAGQHATMTFWDPELLSLLAGSFHVIVFDLPGVGYSPATSGPPSIAKEADVTAGLISALGLSDTTVLGWGLGGEVALSLLERHPGAASRLVLVDTTANQNGAPGPDPAASAVMANPSSTATELASVMFTSKKSAAAFLSRLQQVTPDVIVEDGVALQSGLVKSAEKSHAIADQLSTITVPSLVVVGARDELFPERDSTLLAHGLKARLVIYPGAGYAAILQNEGRFLSELVHFAGT